jgi:16S rRNA U516 pseudouridylate synthase RsuA-like enzyme
VNDIVAHIGQVIDPEVDKVRIGDEIVKEQSELVYYVYNKPRDIVTTCLSGQEGEK